MRLAPLLFVVALCVALGSVWAFNDETVQDDGVVELLNLADQGEGHQNEGARLSRAFFGGGYCCGGGGGGYRRRGYWRGGYRRGGGCGRGGCGERCVGGDCYGK